MKGNRQNSSAGKIFDIFNYTFMIFVLFIMIMPFYYVLINSLTSDVEILKNGYSLLYPKHISFKAYILLLTSNSRIINALGVTVFIAIVGTLCNLMATIAFAYSLSRKDLPGRYVLMLILIISMIFSGGIIPYVLVVKYLHLMDTIWVYIIPSLVNPFFVVLMRNYLMDLPESLRESALIDGAKEFRILLNIIIPLSKPAIAAIGLFYMVGNWNKWYESIMFIRNENLFTLQYHLYRVLQSAQNISDKSTSVIAQNQIILSAESLKFATVIIAITPIMMVYPFAQKYFIKGIMIGAVKG